MYQSKKELRAAPGRAALITITVGMIAVMVTFLSALASGLSAQSVSALEEVYGDSEAVVIADGASSLSSSSIDASVQDAVRKWADSNGATVRQVDIARARVGETPVTVISDPSLADGEVAVTRGVAGKKDSSGVTPLTLEEGKVLTLSGPMGDHDATVSALLGDKWLDHQAVVFAGKDTMKALSGGASVPPSALVVDESRGEMPATDGATVLRGADRNNLSASYQGEQTSLNAMTTMLYVISALVVGAFFTVWTVQRLRGVAITSALGASRTVLVADSLAQVVAVLIIGVGGGVAVTAAAGLALANAEVMPVGIDATTTVIPGLILAATGVIGALLALVPVFRVDPTTALANA
nr:ABC transporter permease [Corynebacterium lactis]